MPINGNKLKELRKQRGLSPANVADKLGISRQAYLKYENGETKQPRKLDAIAHFFNVTPDYLMDYDNFTANYRLAALQHQATLSSQSVRTVSDEDMLILDAYHNAPEAIQTAVDGLLEPYTSMEDAEKRSS